MKKKHHSLRVRGATFTLILFLCAPIITFAQSIVRQNGLLKVTNNRVTNESSQPISLAGNSIFWSNFSEGAKFYNAETVAHAANDWNTSIIRAAMGVEDSQGYLTNPTREMNKVKAVVDAAIENGIYVIIDWHSHNAELYQGQAIEFFTEMSRLYGQNKNVIYEIYNEPINQSWTTIKNYAEPVIDAIRANDPDNLIVVGTSFFSQRVEEASRNPIDDVNLAYTLHFYAGTHRQELRDEAIRAMNNGIALFVTEWGAVNADGDGGVDREETLRWMEFLQEYKISHANWSISDKAEGASVVASNAGVNGFVNNNLTSTGVFIKDIISNWQGTPPPVDTCTGTGVSITSRIEAEDFCSQLGVLTEPTEDIGGGTNVGYLDQGDFLKYRINFPSTGTYEVKYRVASQFDSGALSMRIGNNIIDRAAIPFTDGWQSWTTITSEVEIPVGNRTVELFIESGGFNINWIEITPKNNAPIELCTGAGKNIENRIEAEDFCEESGIKTEPASDIGGGTNIGYLDNGDFVKYRINFPEAGTYTVQYRVASDLDVGELEFRDGDTVLNTTSIPFTDGWQEWTSISSTIEIGQGSKTITLFVKSGGFNINWFKITPKEKEDDPVDDLCPGEAKSIDFRIEAEDFCLQTGVQTENTSDIGGGLNVGYLDNGDYMQYKIYFPSSGEFEIKYRVASPFDSALLELVQGDIPISEVNIPNTGGWQNWTTISSRFNMNAGTTILTLYVKSGGFNVNWVEISKVDSVAGAPAGNCGGQGLAIDSLIEAEDFCEQSGAEVGETSDAGGGFNLGFLDEGDYMKYRINFPVSGSYQVHYRVSTIFNTGAVQVRNNGAVLSETTITSTGDWNNWETVTDQIEITGGNQTIELYVKNGGFNLNWIRFILISDQKASPLDGITTSEKPEITLYPVPAKNTLNLAGVKERMRVDVYDINNRTVLSQEIDINQTTIDISQLPAGSYFVKYDNEKYQTFGRFFKQ